MAPAAPAASKEAAPPVAATGHLTAETKSRVSTPGNGSPRQSSEDSYDVVSSQVSQSGKSDAGTAKPKKADASDEEEEDEDDDDEEDDEEEDEEDEEEEDSDWE